MSKEEGKFSGLYFCNKIIRLNIDSVLSSVFQVLSYTMKWWVLSLSLSANSHTTQGFEGLSKSHLFCLSVWLASQRTCLPPPVAPSKIHVPGHQIGTVEGGWGVKHHYIKLISWRLWCCTQLGLLYRFTNTVSRRLTEKYLESELRPALSLSLRKLIRTSQTLLLPHTIHQFACVIITKSVVWRLRSTRHGALNHLMLFILLVTENLW